MKNVNNAGESPRLEKIETANGVYFVRNQNALVNTLFAKNGTASGVFKVRKNGILFSAPTGEPFAFLVANTGQSKFFVSCSRQEGGKIRYQYGLSENDSLRLGLNGKPYSCECELAENIWLLAKATK